MFFTMYDKFCRLCYPLFHLFPCPPGFHDRERSSHQLNPLLMTFLWWFLFFFSWFLLVAFQNVWIVRTSSRFARTRLHLFLAILTAFLVLWDSWGAMVSTIACCRHSSDYYIYFLMEKKLFLSHSLYIILLLQNLGKGQCNLSIPIEKMPKNTWL